MMLWPWKSHETDAVKKANKRHLSCHIQWSVVDGREYLSIILKEDHDIIVKHGSFLRPPLGGACAPERSISSMMAYVIAKRYTRLKHIR